MTQASPDIRWQQRFDNYKQALATLQAALGTAAQRPLSDLERQGLIQGFEFTFELAWNVMKDFFASRGETQIYGSRDAIRQAFRLGLIDNGDLWMDMLHDRNRSSHSYDAHVAEDLAKNIIQTYFGAFQAFAGKMTTFLEDA
jgi:nucleotidyltransferase substrate binding protein (TIGR01987 family)